ncbi:hypothetical protein JCGZ_08304 [Jatropha curcas]|uniref:CL9 n=1 Tax=Jatropha curcas TaxID=180498 RepID=A0A067KR21_JATCU|nr:hypothetical protein JCGZ_08304 [Jatropha curcas]
MAYVQHGRNALWQIIKGANIKRSDSAIPPLLYFCQGVRYRKLDVILTTNIEKLGKAGETVKVAPGYFRNHLMPKLLAVPNIDKFAYLIREQRKIYQPEEEEEIKVVVETVEDKMKEYETAARRLTNSQLTIRAGINAEKFRARATKDEAIEIRTPVTVDDIVKEVARQLNVLIEPDNLHLPSPLTTFGEHDVQLRLPKSIPLPEGKVNWTLKVKIRGNSRNSRKAIKIGNHKEKKFYEAIDKEQIKDAHKVFNRLPQPDIVAYSALLAGYARKGCVKDTKELFSRREDAGVELNLISWNGMIVGFTHRKNYSEAVIMFQKMHLEGFRPDGTSFSSVLYVVGGLKILDMGFQIHGLVIKQGLEQDNCVVSALIDICSKNGKDIEALEIFREMQDVGVRPNSVTIPCLLPGYGNIAALMHGKAAHCFSLKSGISSNVYGGSALIDMFANQGGLTDEGWNYFKSMSNNYGIKARLEHYACMVNLLGWAGRLQEAYTLIKQMPFDPDACVWCALLSSCGVYKNVVLIFALEPKNPGNYILVSNIYASKGMWVEVNMVRDMLKSRGLRKNPSYSWIEVKSKVHMLIAGDNSHPQMTQNIEKLAELRMEMKKSGCFLATDFVLQDVAEQDKEQILCGHSEKLAVAGGLLNTSPGSPLQTDFVPVEIIGESCKCFPRFAIIIHKNSEDPSSSAQQEIQWLLGDDASKGIAVDRLIGFQDLGGKDDFTEKSLKILLIKKGIISEKKDNEDDEDDDYLESRRRTVRSSADPDSDSD